MVCILVKWTIFKSSTKIQIFVIAFHEYIRTSFDKTLSGRVTNGKLEKVFGGFLLVKEMELASTKHLIEMVKESLKSDER